MALEGLTVGVWSDLDCPNIRLALRTLHLHQLPILYLDGAGIPLRYKTRRVAGEPVPANVLAGMERCIGEEPWEVRDCLLTEVNWTPGGIQWDRLPIR